MPNIASSTREMWEASVKDQIYMALPLTAMLFEHKREKVSGTKIQHTVGIDTHESLYQAYSVNDPLTSGDKTILALANWLWKKSQVPVEYNADEEIQNQGADQATAPIDLIEAKVASAQEGMRRGLNSAFWTAPASPYEGATLKNFQGIQGALLHDIVYGGITRTIGSTLATYWQGASLADDYADAATAVTPSIPNLRRMIQIVRRHRPNNEKLYAIMDEKNHAAFKAQVQASITYPDSGSKNLKKYGFDTFTIDGVEMVCDSWLDTNSGYATTYKYFALLNPATWVLHIHPDRNMKLRPFKWQGEGVNGLDKYVARALVAGNLVCTQPNANMFKSNMA